MKHKKALKLTDQQAADVAAFMASAASKGAVSRQFC